MEWVKITEENQHVCKADNLTGEPCKCNGEKEQNKKMVTYTEDNRQGFYAKFEIIVSTPEEFETLKSFLKIIDAKRSMYNGENEDE